MSGPRPTGEPPPQRMLLPDARGVERFLRVSWHPDARQFVLSTWDGEECVGAVRLMAEAAADLMGMLADGLAEATSGAPAPSGHWHQAYPSSGAA